MNKIIEDLVARPLKEQDYGRYTEYSFQFQNKIREAGGDEMLTPGYTEPNLVQSLAALRNQELRISTYESLVEQWYAAMDLNERNRIQLLYEAMHWRTTDTEYKLRDGMEKRYQRLRKDDKDNARIVATIMDYVQRTVTQSIWDSVKLATVTPTTPLVRLLAVQHTLDVKMEGNQETIREAILQGLRDLPKVHTITNLREAINSISTERSKLEQSMTRYGGNRSWNEQTFVTILGKAMDNSSRFTSYKLLIQIADPTVTFEDIKTQFKVLIDKEYDEDESEVLGMAYATAQTTSKAFTQEDLDKAFKNGLSKGKRGRNDEQGGGDRPDFNRKAQAKGVCFDWMSGDCKRGTNCRFKHSRSELSSRNTSGSSTPRGNKGPEPRGGSQTPRRTV
jgi:hypothetical protein